MYGSLEASGTFSGLQIYPGRMDQVTLVGAQNKPFHALVVMSAITLAPVGIKYYVPWRTSKRVCIWLALLTLHNRTSLAQQTERVSHLELRTMYQRAIQAAHSGST
jgi:hypothetical protein